MNTLVAFSIGLIMGTVISITILYVLIEEADRRYRKPEPIIRDGIDPDELIAWIQNSNDNYEYVSPPTASEIITKIREMEAEG